MITATGNVLVSVDDTDLAFEHSFKHPVELTYLLRYGVKAREPIHLGLETTCIM